MKRLNVYGIIEELGEIAAFEKRCDGKADIAMFSDGRWYLQQSAA